MTTKEFKRWAIEWMYVLGMWVLLGLIAAVTIWRVYAAFKKDMFFINH